MAINQSIFRNIAGQMPGQNQQVVSGLQEAARAQMQSQIGGAAPLGQPLGIRQVQQLGAQATAAQAQPLLQVQEQAQKQAAQMGQLALQQQQQDSQRRLQERQLDQSRAQRQFENQLNTLNSNVKQRLFDDQLQFQKDELGRTFFNERQLMDYKLATAKSQVEMRDFEQKLRQAGSRKMQLLKSAQAKLTQELQQNFAKGQQELDQASTKKLVEAKRAIEEKIRREQAAARNRASMVSAIGTLGGIAIAAALPGPLTAAYAMAGAAGGQGAANILEGSGLFG